MGRGSRRCPRLGGRGCPGAGREAPLPPPLRCCGSRSRRARAGAGRRERRGSAGAAQAGGGGRRSAVAPPGRDGTGRGAAGAAGLSPIRSAPVSLPAVPLPRAPLAQVSGRFLASVCFLFPRIVSMRFRTSFRDPSFRNLVLRTLSQCFLYSFQTFQTVLFLYGVLVFILFVSMCVREKRKLQCLFGVCFLNKTPANCWSRNFVRKLIISRKCYLTLFTCTCTNSRK